MVAPGETVNEGQPVMELETDNAVIEVPSTVAGKVQEVKVQTGQKIKVGSVIFTVEDGAPAKGAAAKPAVPKNGKPAQKEAAQPKQEAPAPTKTETKPEVRPSTQTVKEQEPLGT